MEKKRTFYLKTKDYSVSGDSFELHHSNAYDILETRPKPSHKALSAYYKSNQYISHKTTGRNVFDWAYFLVRKFTLKRKIALISSFSFKQKTLLDFGAGVGSFVRAAHKAGWKSIGIERSFDARKAANKLLKDSVFADDYITKLKPQSQSVITLWHVLEHLPKPKSKIKEFNRLLKKDGRLIIAVPNYKSYDAEYFNVFWAAYDVPRHLWHFSPQSIIQLFSELGFELESSHPLLFDAYYVSLLSTKYKYGKIKIIKSLWIGFQSNRRAKRTGNYSSLIYVLKKIKT